jgi:hypothetical protein
VVRPPHFPHGGGRPPQLIHGGGFGHPQGSVGGGSRSHPLGPKKKIWVWFRSPLPLRPYLQGCTDEVSTVTYARDRSLQPSFGSCLRVDCRGSSSGSKHVAPQILIVLFLIYLFDNIIQLISLRSLWYYGGWQLDNGSY